MKLNLFMASALFFAAGTLLAESGPRPEPGHRDPSWRKPAPPPPPKPAPRPEPQPGPRPDQRGPQNAPGQPDRPGR